MGGFRGSKIALAQGEVKVRIVTSKKRREPENYVKGGGKRGVNVFTSKEGGTNESQNRRPKNRKS